jgi:hypothetical protein
MPIVLLRSHQQYSIAFYRTGWAKASQFLREKLHKTFSSFINEEKQRRKRSLLAPAYFPRARKMTERYPLVKELKDRLTGIGLLKHCPLCAE